MSLGPILKEIAAIILELKRSEVSSLDYKWFFSFIFILSTVKWIIFDPHFQCLINNENFLKCRIKTKLKLK